MPPWQGGGDMIRSVTFEKTTVQRPAVQVRGGTPHIAGAIGLGAALDYVSGDRDGPHCGHTSTSCWFTAPKRSVAVDGVRLIGTARDKAAVLSFVLEGVHPHDIGTILDRAASRFAPGTIAPSR